MSSPTSETLDLAHLDESGFRTLYRERIEPCFVAHEPERIAAVKTFHQRITIGLPIAMAIGVGAYALIREIFPTVIIFGVFAAMAYAFAYTKLEQVAVAVKQAALNAICQAIGVSYAMEHFDPPALPVFRRFDLLPGYARSKFEDLFSGTYRDAAFDLYEAHLETKHTDSKGRTSYSTVFRGQVLRLSFPREFLGVTIVRRDMGMFNAFAGMGELKRVGLEDPKFEKVFEVFGNDQVEARYLVHPVLMERLMALEESFKGKQLRCGFVGGNMLIAIEGGNLFEIGDLFKPLADPARARKIVDEIGSVMHVMEAVLTAQAQRPPRK